MTVQATFAYEGIRVGVNGLGGPDIQWLKEFLLPWFELAGPGADVLLEIRRDPDHYRRLCELPHGPDIDAFMLDTERIAFPGVQVPGEDVALHDAEHRLFYLVAGNRVRLVACDPLETLRTCFMRVIRELATGTVQLAGHRFLHASSFAVGGRAAIVAGPRRAGKTSLLCYALSRSGAQFLSNDRLLLQATGSGLRVRGMPTIVSVRAGTLELFPEMRQTIERGGFSNRKTMAECLGPIDPNTRSSQVERRGLTAIQFCAALNSRPLATAGAAVLLFPRQTGQRGGLSLQRLSTAQTRAHLADCLFANLGPDRLSGAFTLAPTRLARASAPLDSELFELLAERLPAFECRMGLDSFSDDAGIGLLCEVLAATGVAPATDVPAAGDP